MQDPGIGGLVPPLLKCKSKKEVKKKNREYNKLVNILSAKSRLDTQNVSPTSVLAFPESPNVMDPHGDSDSTPIVSSDVISNATHDLVTRAGHGPILSDPEDRTDLFGSLQKNMETKPSSVSPSIIDKSSRDTSNDADNQLVCKGGDRLRPKETV